MPYNADLKVQYYYLDGTESHYFTRFERNFEHEWQAYEYAKDMTRNSSETWTVTCTYETGSGYWW